MKLHRIIILMLQNVHISRQNVKKVGTGSQQKGLIFPVKTWWPPGAILVFLKH